MSEINPKPTEALTWGEGGTPNAHDEPLASCTDGYYEGTAPDHADADVLPAGHLNWLFRAFTRWFNWLAGLAHREFDEIDDAVTAGLAWPERFDYVRRAAVVEPGGQNYSVQGIAGAAFTAGTPIHDGRNVYYAQGGRLVCARLGSPGTRVWHYDATTAFSAIACDGRYVYVGDTGVNGVRLIDPEDGSVYATWNDHAGTTPIKIVACGRWVALIDTGDTGVLHLYGHTSAGVKSYPGSYDHGAPITAMCTQGNCLYIGSSAAGTGGDYLRCLSLPGLTATWEVDPGWLSTPTFTGLTCDGRCLYAGTDTDEVTAGVEGHVHSFAAIDGSRLWSAYLAASGVVEGITHDHELVAVYDSNAATSYTLDKVTGQILLALPSTRAWMLDGARLMGFGNTDEIQRYWLGRGAVRYQMNETYDQYRPMPWMVATPLK